MKIALNKIKYWLWANLTESGLKHTDSWRTTADETNKLVAYAQAAHHNLPWPGVR